MSTCPFESDVLVATKFELYEHNIVELEYAASSTWNRAATPRDGVVKWFGDESGKMWVKWNHPTMDKNYVIPADRVVIVTYGNLSRMDG